MPNVAATPAISSPLPPPSPSSSGGCTATHNEHTNANDDADEDISKKSVAAVLKEAQQIPRGTLLLREKPFAYALNNEVRGTRCDFCFAE